MRFLTLLTCLVTLLFGAVAVQADQIKVAAAANLEQIFNSALIPAFTQKTHIQVTPVYGSTKLLALQVKNGAPMDAFISADTETVQELAASGFVDPSSVAPYAVGKLVIWSRKDAAHHPKSVRDLADLAYAKIAIANPKVAPYGLAADQAMQAAGIFDTVQPRLVQAENISQCLQYAQSGNADVAMTALSLVIDDKSDPYIIVPAKLHEPILQSLGLIKATAHPVEAKQFIAYLLARDTVKIWKQYGYDVPKHS